MPLTRYPLFLLLQFHFLATSTHGWEPQLPHLFRAHNARRSAVDLTPVDRRTFGQVVAASSPALWRTRAAEAVGFSPLLYQDTLATAFPNALTYRQLKQRVADFHRPVVGGNNVRRASGTGSTLLATSLCCDELNRNLEQELSRQCTLF